jgi:outer membrane protein assembly factor BamB
MRFEFDSDRESFGEFETELEDIEVKKIKKFERIWKNGFGGSVCYSKMFGKRVYFGCMDHYVYCIDADTGEEIWRFKTDGSVLSSVSDVYNNVIYVGGYGGELHAIDFNSGKEIWRFKTGDKIFCCPIMYNEKVYFGSKDGNLYCLCAKTGEEIWRFKTGDEITSNPGAHEGRIYTGSYDGNFYCLDAETGKEVWRFRVGAEIQIDNKPLINNGIIYIPCWDNYIYAIDAKNGKEIWRTKLGHLGISASPVLYKNVLYISTRDGFLFAVSLEGKELWRFKTAGIIIGIGIKDNVIYFGSEDRNFYAVNLEGEELWRLQISGPVYDFPHFYKNNVYFGSWDCHLYCLDSKTGREIWRFTTSTLQPSWAPPPHEEFKIEIKKSLDIEDSFEKKYKFDDLTISTNDFKSEYSTSSEYKRKSDYDTQWIIFEDGSFMEVSAWISNSEGLTQDHLENLKRN